MQENTIFEQGAKVFVISGKHAGSVGVVEKIIPKYHVKVSFMGTSKTLPAEHLKGLEEGTETNLTKLFHEEIERS